jgi:hypothetical protein
MAAAGRDGFKQAASEGDVGLFRELWGFVRATKKWWLLPIIAVVVLFGVLIFLSGTGAAPFIYTLF